MTKIMSKEQTPITAEEFDRVIRQINAVDTSQDQWEVRKKKIDILKEFTQTKVLEALEKLQFNIEGLAHDEIYWLIETEVKPKYKL